MSRSGTSLNLNALPKRIPEVDGLRGIAILGVLVFHFIGEGIDYQRSHWLINYLAETSKYGAGGVDLFFVISGFLIGGILIDNRDSLNYFKTFYLRRTLRIFPLYYSLIIIFYGLSWANAYHLITMPVWMLGFTFSSKWYLTFTQNFPMVRDSSLGTMILAPTWSLAVEEQFYLTLPFIIRFAPRKLLIWLVVILICFASIFRTVIWFQTSNTFAVKFLMPSCLDSLMMGVLIAILLRTPKSSILIEKYRLRLMIPIYIILVIFLHGISNFVLRNSTVLADNPLIFTNTEISIRYGLLLMLAVTAKPKEMLSRFFCNKVLRKFGELSYFIYLFHLGFYFLVRWQMGINENLPFGIIWGVEISLTLLITLVLAQLSWRFFEKPLINYGHRFKYEDDKTLSEENKKGILNSYDQNK